MCTEKGLSPCRLDGKYKGSRIYFQFEKRWVNEWNELEFCYPTCRCEEQLSTGRWCLKYILSLHEPHYVEDQSRATISSKSSSLRTWGWEFACSLDLRPGEFKRQWIVEIGAWISDYLAVRLWPRTAPVPHVWMQWTIGERFRSLSIYG